MNNSNRKCVTTIYGEPSLRQTHVVLSPLSPSTKQNVCAFISLSGQKKTSNNTNPRLRKVTVTPLLKVALSKILWFQVQPTPLQTSFRWLMSPVLSHRVRLYSTSPQPRSSAEQTAAHPPHSCRHLHHNTACLSFSETPHGLLTCHTYQPLACACLWFASCTYPHFFPGEQVTEVKGTLIGVASAF